MMILFNLLDIKYIDRELVRPIDIQAFPSSIR
jgi:hypothetical protein